MLEAWIATHRLTELWQPLVATTTSWIASAAPAWATDEQRALACMDLGTCFFILDDTDPPAALGRHADLARIAAGAPPDPARPLQLAFVALFARLGELGPLAHYLAVRGQFARALDLRHALRTAQAVDAGTYLALREITIYFEPWLALWEVLGGYVLSAEERALVAPAFEPANRWQAIENDRVSLARDLRTGTPNLVALVAAERAVGLAEATLEIRDRSDRELAAYRAAMHALRATSPSPAVARYLDALECGVEGALRHHRGGADPARYEA